MRNGLECRHREVQWQNRIDRIWKLRYSIDMRCTQIAESSGILKYLKEKDKRKWFKCANARRKKIGVARRAKKADV